jgi:hypothetical protein
MPALSTEAQESDIEYEDYTNNTEKEFGGLLVATHLPRSDGKQKTLF